MQDSKLSEPKREYLKSILDNELEKGCIHKRQYSSIEKARLVAARQNKKHETNMSAYKCAFCRQFHIGHKPKAVWDRLSLIEMKNALSNG